MLYVEAIRLKEMEEKMIETFITVFEGVITGKHCGDFKADFNGTPYNGHERIKVPPDTLIISGEPIAYYTDDWKRKSNSSLIKEGVMQIPEGYVWEDERLRPMTPVELIANGLKELPVGYKILDGKILPMTLEERVINGLDEMPKGCKIVDGHFDLLTPEEQHEAGLISDEDWQQIKLEEAEKELNNRLQKLQTPEALAMAEIDTEYAVERKAKLIALLAVKQQEGWPDSIEWPN